MVKFKYFKTLAVYNNNASTIANDDIVFIEDDNSLVTHGKTYKFVEPEHEYKVDNIQNLVVSDTTSGSITLSPNVFYSLGTLTGSLSVTLGTPVDDIPNIYSMEFESGTSTSRVPNFPSSIKWNADITWVASKHYEVNIRYDAKTSKYYGIITQFDKAT